MNYVTTEEKEIFTATQDGTVVLEMWIDCKQEDVPMDGVVGRNLNIRCGEKYYNENSAIGGPSDNENADIVHQINMKAGDTVMASFSKDNLLRYNFSDYDAWYAEERRKIDEKLYGKK